MRLKEQDIIEIAKMIDDDISLTRIALKFNYSEEIMGENARRYKKHRLII